MLDGDDTVDFGGQEEACYKITYVSSVPSAVKEQCCRFRFLVFDFLLDCTIVMVVKGLHSFIHHFITI